MANILIIKQCLILFVMSCQFLLYFLVINSVFTFLDLKLLEIVYIVLFRWYW